LAWGCTSTIAEADSVSVTAKASSTIKAETLAISLSIGVGGTVGGAASLRFHDEFFRLFQVRLFAVGHVFPHLCAMHFAYSCALAER